MLAVALAAASAVFFFLAAFGVAADAVDLPLVALGLLALAFAASWAPSTWPTRRQG